MSGKNENPNNSEKSPTPPQYCAISKERIAEINAVVGEK